MKSSSKNKERNQRQSNEKKKPGAEHETERLSENKSLPELLQVEKASQKNAMADAIKENMEAVEKSNK